MCNETMRIRPDSFFPEHLKTQEKCIIAIEKNLSCHLENAHDKPKTQEMCNKTVRKDPCLLEGVLDHNKTPDVCNKAEREDLTSMTISNARHRNHKEKKS